MVAVVVDHADAGSFASQLKPPVHAAEVLERGPNVVGFDVEADSYRNGCGRIQDVVHSRHMQAEFAEVAFSRRSRESG